MAIQTKRARRRKFVGIALIASVAIALVVGVGIHSGTSRAEILRLDPDQILERPKLRDVAMADGKIVYESRCATCHGSGKSNVARGIPDLTDAEYLYETGSVSQIEQIARYGIRAYDKRGWTLASMPAYARAIPYAGEPLPSQTPMQIEALTQYLLSFTGRATNIAAAGKGKAQYVSAGCWDCHGHSAEGDNAVGAPTLSDTVWLFGGSHDAIYRSIALGRAGYSPGFARKLPASELRDVAVYVAAMAPRSIQSRKTP